MWGWLSLGANGRGGWQDDTGASSKVGHWVQPQCSPQGQYGGALQDLCVPCCIYTCSGADALGLRPLRLLLCCALSTTAPISVELMPVFY